MKKIFRSSFKSIISILFLITTTCLGAIQLSAQSRAVYFNGYNSSTATFPKSAAGFNASIVSSATVNYNGLSTVNDNRCVWNNTNSSASLDVGTAPYLSYTINFTSSISLSPDRFVMCGLATFNSAIKMQLRWSIDNYATSLGEFTINGGSYTLTSVNLNPKGTVSASSIQFRVYFYGASTWVFNSDTGPYSSLDGTPSSYGSFGQNVALWYNSFTLPLTWRSFNAQAQKENVLLNWSTENESNTADFEILHSTNGRDWQSIGNITAQNTAGTHEYRFIHNSPVNGNNYYKLEQRDIDNRKTYSNIRLVKFNTASALIYVLSNPVQTGSLQLQAEEPLRMQLYNTGGVLVMDKQLAAGFNQLPVNHLKAGFYLLQAGNEKIRIVIQ
jgi:hypothetical protein